MQKLHITKVPPGVEELWAREALFDLEVEIDTVSIREAPDHVSGEKVHAVMLRDLFAALDDVGKTVAADYWLEKGSEVVTIPLDCASVID